MAVDKIVKIHPVVLFQIADAYERRSLENYRVIGTLLGKDFSDHTSGSQPAYLQLLIFWSSMLF
jgi:hypothetical protein